LYNKGKTNGYTGVNEPTSPFGLIGMSVYNTDATDSRKFDYDLPCATDQPAPDGMEWNIYSAGSHMGSLSLVKAMRLPTIQVHIVTKVAATSDL